MATTLRGSFWVGFLSGVITTVVFVVASLFGAAYLLKDKMVADKAERLKPPPLAEDAQASYDWSVVDAAGAVRPMADFAGKAVFLQFWSSGCTSCEAEIPAMNALFDTLGNGGIEVVAVAADQEPTELKDTAVRLGIRYPIYTLQGTLPEVFHYTAGPATFVIAPDGRIVFKHIGAARWDDPKVIAYLSLLANPAKQE